MLEQQEIDKVARQQDKEKEEQELAEMAFKGKSMKMKKGKSTKGNNPTIAN